MPKVTDGQTQFGGNWLYSASGLQRMVGQMQAGELYIDGVNEATATGFFDPNWDGDLRVSAPHVMVTPVADPSGRFYVSASGTTQFVVTFTTTPYGDDFASTPYHIANWLAVL